MDAGRVVIGSDDKTVKVWDLDSDKLLTLEGHSDDVNGCGWVACGEQLGTIPSRCGMLRREALAHPRGAFSLGEQRGHGWVACGERESGQDREGLGPRVGEALAHPRGHSNLVTSVAMVGGQSCQRECGQYRQGVECGRELLHPRGEF